MLFRLDDYLFHLLYAGSRGPLTTVAMVLSALGGGWAILAILPLAFPPRTRRFAVWLVGTLAVTAAVVFALKGMIGRGRPCTVYGGLGLALLGSPTDCSLPSGHAAGSFAFAFFVMEVLRVRPRSRYAVAASTALIVFASGVALSRVVLGFHFPLESWRGRRSALRWGWSRGDSFTGAREALGPSQREETRPKFEP